MNDQVTLHKALVTIKKLKNMLKSQQNNQIQPIAIVGISCRYPDAIGKDAYWKLLTEGKNIISKIPEERWDLLKGSDEMFLKDDSHAYHGGYLSNVNLFDPYFFGISPREAIRMDPQHRLLLEVAYEAIEDAGIQVEKLAGTNTGVFSSLYVSQLAHMQEMESELDALFLPTGNAISIAANRISYLFDLRGPSIILDSACSSSMAAMHMACLNLQSKACDLALVCGAKLNLLPYVNLVLSKAKMLSPDGQCKTFDAEANGYVQGEGVGVIVLKPLDRALKDNDRIYSVIMGSAVNQDGKTNGLTAPNGLQQEALLKSAHVNANINPNDISYIECHGTGTFLGDPIEIQALGEVIGKKRSNENPCWIGSVKTNIGHLEPAAGVSSVIKASLALYNKKIPPHLNFHNPNPHIQFDKYHLTVPTQVEDMPKYGDHRIVGVSGFGFGGTNAHVILREQSSSEIKIDTESSDNSLEIFTISAKDPAALKLLINSWTSFLKSNSLMPLAKVCYNAHLRRAHYSHRLAILAKSTDELIKKLETINQDTLPNEYKTDGIFLNFKMDSLVAKMTEEISTLKQDLTKLATYYVNRAAIDWDAFEKDRFYSYFDMPHYPWQHKSYWPALGHKNKGDIDISEDSYPLRGRQLLSPLNLMQFEFKIDTKKMPDIQDTYNVFHAGYYLEVMTFIVNQIANRDDFTLEDLTFLSPLIVPNDTVVSIQVTLDKTPNENWIFHFYSNIQGQKNWVEHATGLLSLGATTIKRIDSIDDIKARSSAHGEAESLYKKVIELGMPAGESIRWTHRYWTSKNEVLCEFQQPKAHRKNEEFKMKIHPGIIDGSIQPIFLLLPQDATKPYIASHVDKLKHFGIKNGPYYLLIDLKELNADSSKIICNSYIVNSAGEVVFEGENVSLAQLDNKIQIQQLIQLHNEKKLDLSALSPEERKQKTLEFLIEQTAVIFSMPKSDIDINQSLRDLGIDSLMSLVLMRTIEAGLDVSYSMQDLLQGPTLAQLATAIVSDGKFTTDSITPSASTALPKPKASWITYRKPQKNAKLKLFCFPYGGGGASIYRDWQKSLPDTIELCPIQLPGREERMNEAVIKDIHVLVDTLVTQLSPEMNMPFAFFGHSFGSLIAFELARELRRKHLPQPVHLFASAFPNPDVPAKSLDKMIFQLKKLDLNLFDLDEKAIGALSSNQLINLANIFSENGVAGYGEHIMDKDIVKALLPIFIGDMGIVKSYQYYEEKPLDFPISVFLGKHDSWVETEDQLTWGDHTINHCEFFLFDSGHLFIRDNQIKELVIKSIVDALVTETDSVSVI